MESAGKGPQRPKIKKLLDKGLLGLIGLYRVVGSLWLSGSCRFEPSCSAYGEEAVKKYGFWHGGRLTVKRVLRCRPGGDFGYDPVP